MSMQSLIAKFGVDAAIERPVYVTTVTGSKKLDKWIIVKQIKVWLQPVSAGRNAAKIVEEYHRRNITITIMAYTLWFDEAVLTGDRLTIDDSPRKMTIHGAIDQAGIKRLYRLDVEEKL